MIGVDEVGRGALCGAVYIGICKLWTNFPRFTKSFDPSNQFWMEQPDFGIVKDSKKLPEPIREKVFSLVERSNIEFLTLFCSNQLIDQYGIGVCLSYLVAIGLSQPPFQNSEEQILIDGQIKLLNSFDEELIQAICSENNLLVPNINFPKDNIVRENRADDKYLSVALASNIAKVTRDRVMIELSQGFPDFHWQQNKGYGTLLNRQAIKNNPHNPYVRRTFCQKILKN